MLRQSKWRKRECKSRAVYGLSSCVRMEKAGHSAVCRLPILSETKIFGVAIQDSGSQPPKKVGGGVGGEGIEGGWGLLGLG